MNTLHLTSEYICVHNYWHSGIRLHKEAGLLEMKVNWKGFVWMKISFDLGKNEHHKASGLGDRSIVAIRQ